MMELMGQNTGPAWADDERWPRVTHWVARDQRVIKIEEIENGHLVNLLNYFTRNADSLFDWYRKKRGWQDVQWAVSTTTSNTSRREASLIWLAQQPIFRRLVVEHYRRGLKKTSKTKFFETVINYLLPAFDIPSALKLLKGEVTSTAPQRHKRGIELPED